MVRRIKLVLAALAIMVATFVAGSGSAMAEDLNCHDAWGNMIRCDGTYYAPVNDYGYNNHWNPYWYGYTNYWNPFWYGYYRY